MPSGPALAPIVDLAEPSRWSAVTCLGREDQENDSVGIFLQARKNGYLCHIINDGHWIQVVRILGR